MLTELRSVALDLPFFLLPFRPESDHSAVRGFLRRYFDGLLHVAQLQQELRPLEPLVCSSLPKTNDFSLCNANGQAGHFRDYQVVLE